MTDFSKVKAHEIAGRGTFTPIAKEFSREIGKLVKPVDAVCVPDVCSDGKVAFTVHMALHEMPEEEVVVDGDESLDVVRNLLADAAQKAVGRFRGELRDAGYIDFI